MGEAQGQWPAAERLPALLAASALYLATPLLRHGSSATRWEWWSFAGLIVLFALYALFGPSPEAGEAASGEAASSSAKRDDIDEPRQEP